MQGEREDSPLGYRSFRSNGLSDGRRPQTPASDHYPYALCVEKFILLSARKIKRAVSQQ